MSAFYISANIIPCVKSLCTKRLIVWGFFKLYYFIDQTAGQTVIIGKRPTKGHGREIVQLGVPIIEGPPDDENERGSSSSCCITSCFVSYLDDSLFTFKCESRDKGGSGSWAAA